MLIIMTSPTSDEECLCDNCKYIIGEDDTIFIFQNWEEDDTMTFCDACGDDLEKEMNREGYFRDDDEDWESIQIEKWQCQQKLEEAKEENAEYEAKEAELQAKIAELKAEIQAKIAEL